MKEMRDRTPILTGQCPTSLLDRHSPAGGRNASRASAGHTCHAADGHTPDEPQTVPPAANPHAQPPSGKPPGNSSSKPNDEREALSSWYRHCGEGIGIQDCAVARGFFGEWGGSCGPPPKRFSLQFERLDLGEGLRSGPLYEKVRDGRPVSVISSCIVIGPGEDRVLDRRAHDGQLNCGGHGARVMEPSR